jgi:hypothetical protein
VEVLRGAPAPVRIEFVGTEPHLFISLHDPGSRQQLAQCQGSCELRMPAGRYRLAVTNASGSPRRVSDRYVNLLQDGSYNVRPPNFGARRGGLILAIASMTAFPFAGLACAFSENSHVPCGVWGMSAVGTTMGWMIFGHNRRPTLERRRMTPAAAKEAIAGGWAVGASVPARSGDPWMGALSGRF